MGEKSKKAAKVKAKAPDINDEEFPGLPGMAAKPKPEEAGDGEDGGEGETANGDADAAGDGDGEDKAEKVRIECPLLSPLLWLLLLLLLLLRMIVLLSSSLLLLLLFCDDLFVVVKLLLVVVVMVLCCRRCRCSWRWPHRSFLMVLWVLGDGHCGIVGVSGLRHVPLPLVSQHEVLNTHFQAAPPKPGGCSVLCRHPPRPM